MLKLISRIIEPSSGVIAVDGRVSALLELGAGFHQDLTGRENIYLNGSILGFSKAQMGQIFDDIVTFSELQRFIDMPVKHYSSGMYMRLGFSIAIHVRPDILLVDEVLAVGDQAFQLRCLDKINELKRQGITIVLVTHDIETVRTMCSRAIWLEDGQIQAEGNTDHVIEQYVAQALASDGRVLRQAEAARQKGDRTRPQAGPNNGSSWRWGTREGEITCVQFLDSQGRDRRSFRTGETFVVRIHFSAKQRLDRPLFGLALFHASGFHINGPNTALSGLEIEALDGEGYIDHVVERLPLLEGSYLASVSLYDHQGIHAYDYHHQAYTFRVRPSNATREKYGSFLIASSWRPGPTGFVGQPPGQSSGP